MPCIKRPVRNKPKLLALAAGINTKVPRAITSNPNAIPFLKPVYFKINEEGKARKK